MVFKLYIDSSFKRETGGSVSDSEFSIELPHPLQVKGKAFVDTCLVPNVFYNIREDNNRIHLVEDANNSPNFRIVYIAPGQYNVHTLKDAMVTALNSGRVIAGQYQVTYHRFSNKYDINNLDQTDKFALYPIAWFNQFADLWNGGAASNHQVDPKNLRDSGFVTGFASGGINQQSAPNAKIDALECPNLQPYSQLFLRSSLGDGYSAIGPDGSSDIIRRIVVGGTPMNGVIVDQHGLPYDSVPMGRPREITTLSFRLTDADGKTVDMLGHHISFSIIFIADDE